MIQLVTGGARSGKSSFILEEINRYAPEGKLAFIATARPLDQELKERIARHKAERGPRFFTIEAPILLPDAIREARKEKPAGILVDCLTVWLGNLLVEGPAPYTSIEEAIDDLCEASLEPGPPLLVVTNEVGLGIVPENTLARQYRDLLGLCNRKMAAQADRVSLVVCGIPIRIK
jgi:adenosyl cobinamide kinase/adenosyl cobinamide phosphate guanylyltransferase